MTTEVLRNMLYAGSATLGDLGYVVMDEVHYLADRFRGAVWEEVIIHLPESVRLVSLSATVSNAEEFGDWLAAVRGDTRVVVEEHRPVPLWQHVMVRNRMYDLFADGGHVNPELVRMARDEQRYDRVGDRRPQRGGRRPRHHDTPSRADVIERLDREGLLPGDHLHLQPRRLRRGRPAVPAQRAAADDRRRARADPASSSRSGAPASPTRTCTCSATGSGSTG